MTRIKVTPNTWIFTMYWAVPVFLVRYSSLTPHKDSGGILLASFRRGGNWGIARLHDVVEGMQTKDAHFTIPDVSVSTVCRGVLSSGPWEWPLSAGLCLVLRMKGTFFSSSQSLCKPMFDSLSSRLHQFKSPWIQIYVLPEGPLWVL